VDGALLHAISDSELPPRTNRTRTTANTHNHSATSSTSELPACGPSLPWRCFCADASPGVRTNAASRDGNALPLGLPPPTRSTIRNCLACGCVPVAACARTGLRRFYREPAAAAREEVFLAASISAPLSISIEPLKSAPSSIKICTVVKFPFTEPPFLISIFPVARTFPFT
jgi:hypothetical protein